MYLGQRVIFFMRCMFFCPFWPSSSCSFEGAQVPADWKVAKITPLYKKGPMLAWIIAYFVCDSSLVRF